MLKKQQAQMSTWSIAALILIMLTACSNIGTPQLLTPTRSGETQPPTPQIPTTDPATIEAYEARVEATSTAMYDTELQPGEIWERAVDDYPPVEYEDLYVSIGTPYATECTVGETTTETVVADIWIETEERPAAHPRLAQVGQVFELEGYRIRILAIHEHSIDVAISYLGISQSAAAVTYSNYNFEPGEEHYYCWIAEEYQHDLLWFTFSDPGYEEIAVDFCGVVEPTYANLRIWTQDSTVQYEGTVRVGDIIQFEGYQFRVLGFSQTLGILAVSELNGIPEPLESPQY